MDTDKQWTQDTPIEALVFEVRNLRTSTEIALSILEKALESMKQANDRCVFLERRIQLLEKAREGQLEAINERLNRKP